MSSSKSDEWMPRHYRDLKELSIEHIASSEVGPRCWGMSIETFPRPYVKHLSSAASKYRLAKHCYGLLGPSDEARAAAGIAPDFFDKYSSQALIMLSFVAFETHLRMLGTTWQKFPVERCGLDIRSIAEAVREDLGEEALTALAKAMDQDKLKNRIDKFLNGDDREFLAVVSALRNSFSHGKMGVSKSVSPSCAIETKEFMLDLIKCDAELISRSLREQDAALLVV